MKRTFLVFLAFFSAGLFAQAKDELPRQAYLGFSLRMAEPAETGAEVRSVEAQAVADGLGIKSGDHILEINGTRLNDRRTLNRVLHSLHGGDIVRFKIMRAAKEVESSAVLEPLPSEKLPGVQVIHDSVKMKAGFRLRTIITRPLNKTGKLPVIFMVGWLSCDSSEYPLGPDDGFGQLLHDLATGSGMVLFRTDKAGTGDSEGPPCDALDFKTELEGYRASFNSLANYDFIDTSRIYVLGMSNGGGFAPLVTQGRPVKAYIVVGGWVKTWFEHMIELERRRVQLAGMPLERVASAMRGYAEFYDDYLVQKKTPGEVIKAKPQLASLWYDEPDHQYGRPSSFYFQLEDLDLLSAWSTLDVPVLAMHGEYDWVMSGEDHRMIANLANRRRQGAGKFVELEKTNHLLYTYGTPEEAFKGSSSGHYNPAATSTILEFLQQSLL